MKVRVRTFAEIGADKTLEMIAKRVTMLPTSVLGEVCEVIEECQPTNEVYVSAHVPFIGDIVEQKYYIPKELCEVAS